MITESGRLPDFFIVGAARSATTSLHGYLGRHPRIFMPRWKEPMFFSYGDTPFNRHLLTKNLYQYARLFWPARPDQLMGESSTTYLYRYAHTIENLKKTYGSDFKKIKIIISLRNPVDRAFSHYCLSYLHGVENLPFEEAIKSGARERLTKRIGTEVYQIIADFDYLEMGEYYEQVRAYKEAFEDVHIVLYDDLVRDPRAVVRGIFAFLGVEDSPVACGERRNEGGVPKSGALNTCINFLKRIWFSNPVRLRDFAWRCLNIFTEPEARLQRFEWQVGLFFTRLRAKNRRRVTMQPETRRMLCSHYREDIKKLEGLIGRDLSAWTT